MHPRVPALLNMHWAPRDLRKLMVGWWTDADLYMTMLAHGMSRTAAWYSGQRTRASLIPFEVVAHPKLWLFDNGSCEQIVFSIVGSSTPHSLSLTAAVLRGRVDLVRMWESNEYQLRCYDLKLAAMSCNAAMIEHVLYRVFQHKHQCDRCYLCPHIMGGQIGYSFSAKNTIIEAWHEVVKKESISCMEVLYGINNDYTRDAMTLVLSYAVVNNLYVAARWILTHCQISPMRRDDLMQIAGTQMKEIISAHAWVVYNM